MFIESIANSSLQCPGRQDAFEDVGLGGVDAIAFTLIATRSKVWRKKVGELKVLQFIVQMLAQSIKGRSCTDYMIYHWNNPRKFRELNTLRAAPLPELSHFVLSEKHTSAFRSCALWCLIGTDRFECKTLPPRSGSRELFNSTIAAMNIPSLVMYAVIRGVISCRYPMPVMLPILWQMKEKALYMSVENTALPAERHFIEGLPDFTFDQYVREGRSSLAYFGKACLPVTEFLSSSGITSADAKIKAIGAAVFIVEGALLDRKLVFEGSGEIYEAAEVADYKKAGLSLEDGRTLAALIQDNHETLRRSRRTVVGGNTEGLHSLSFMPSYPQE